MDSLIPGWIRRSLVDTEGGTEDVQLELGKVRCELSRLAAVVVSCIVLVLRVVREGS